MILQPGVTQPNTSIAWMWKAISAHAIAVKGTQLTLGENCGLKDGFMVNNYPCSYSSE